MSYMMWHCFLKVFFLQLSLRFLSSTTALLFRFTRGMSICVAGAASNKAWVGMFLWPCMSQEMQSLDKSGLE